MTLLEAHPILLQTPWGPLTAHGVFFALGGVVAAWSLASGLARVGIARFVDGVEHALLIFLAGLLAARLGYLITYMSEWTSVVQLFAIWQGGLVSFWGIVGGLGVAALRARRYRKAEQRIWWREVILAGLLGWAIGRLGNFYMGESGGVVATGWGAFGGLVPIQLFESVWCLILWMALKFWVPSRSTVLSGVGGYLAGRFIIDIWRNEQSFWVLHMSQWAALLGLIVVIIVYATRRTRP
jgi:prolipoprotein diacylglyceryltransferase